MNSSFLCIDKVHIITETAIRPGSLLCYENEIVGIFPNTEKIGEAEISSVFANRYHGISSQFKGNDTIDASRVAEESQRINGLGHYLSPGLIEIHSHGSGGADYSECDRENYLLAAKSSLAHGVTAHCPTSLSSSSESLKRVVDFYSSQPELEDGLPRFLGLHLEGPYFAPEQAGAQDPRFLRNPANSVAEYESIFTSQHKIRRWSFAPELPGGLRFLQRLRQEGIQASLAHSAATTAEVSAAYEAGLNSLTHFYSAMSGVTRRNAYRVGGAIEAGYLLDGLFVEVIADGCHLPAELLQLIYKIKGAERIILVTDSMRAAGLPEGPSILGNKADGLPVIVEDGVAKLPDRSAFAGSVATADRLVRTFRELTEAPLHEIIRMMSINPARLIGIADQTGSIAVGKTADFVIFDEDIEIKQIILRGQILEA